jgi:SPP1 gp7 family putative phage head morphogenesis protein
VIWTEQTISPLDFKALVAAWKQEHQGKGKAHKTSFLQKGLKPERLNSSQKDMEFVELRKLAREETWQVFSMPMGMWTENATEANANVALQTYYNFGLWPLLCLVADKITSDILPAYGEDQVAEYEDIRITDRRLQIAEIETALKTHTVDEVRAEYYDDEPLPSGGEVVLTGIAQTIDASEPEDEPEPALPPPAPLTGAPMLPVIPPPGPVANALANDTARMTAEIAGKAELVKWEAWALKRLRAGMWPPDRAFKHDVLPQRVAGLIEAQLATAQTEQAVKAAFSEPFAVKSDLAQDAARRRLERQMAAAAQEALDEELAAIMQHLQLGGTLPSSFWQASRGRLNGRMVSIISSVTVACSGLARDNLATVAHAGVDPAALNAAIAEWAGRYSAQLIKGIEDTTRNAVQQIIANWTTSGGDMPALRKLLEPIFGRDRAEVIAATEVTRAFAEANRELWKQTGVIQAREWRTANDEIVCPICGGLANAQAELDKPFELDGEEYNDPPAHVNCRCWTVPIIAERLR